MSKSLKASKVSKIFTIASGQHGLFSHSQLAELGVCDATIQNNVATGRWTREASGVYSFPGHADTFDRRAWRAVLGGGRSAALCGIAAAVMHGIARETRFDDHVQRGLEHADFRYDGKSRTRRRLPHDVVHVRGIPVTRIERTLIDCAAESSLRELERLIERAIYKELCTYDSLRQYVDALGLRGRRGGAKLRRILERYVRVRKSELETRFLQLIRDAAIVAPIMQRPVNFATSRKTYRLDAVWPDQHLRVELDGREWHSDRDVFQSDRRRANELAELGFSTLSFTYHDVVNDPEYVIDTLRKYL